MTEFTLNSDPSFSFSTRLPCTGELINSLPKLAGTFTLGIITKIVVWDNNNNNKLMLFLYSTKRSNNLNLTLMLSCK